MYSIKGKDLKTKSPLVPGPGAYNPSIDFSTEKVPSYGIGKSKRELNLSRFNNPGPASYSMDFTSLSGPKWKIGNSMRVMLKKSDTPGPDVYTLPGPGPGLSYSISPSKQTSKPIRTPGPGPGAYSPVHVASSPRAVIGSSKREIKFTNTTPGPGSYAPSLKDSTQNTVCNL